MAEGSPWILGIDCECCGKSDQPCGVAASPLGAFSCAYCRVCLAMGAEPLGYIETTVDICGGLDGVREDVPLIWYDPEVDSYKDFRSGRVLEIGFKDGTRVTTRTEAVRRLKA